MLLISLYKTFSNTELLQGFLLSINNQVLSFAKIVLDMQIIAILSTSELLRFPRNKKASWGAILNKFDLIEFAIGFEPTS